MAGQGRVSAKLATTSLVLSFLIIVISHTDAATFKVGDAGGWTFNVVGWPKGKTFRAGDTLVFNYGQGSHNVVVVNKAGYDQCKVSPSNAKTFKSGSDQIKLVKGPNFFICSFPNHCQNGMKIAVKAL